MLVKTSQNLRPIADRVLVRPIDKTEEKRGGIIIPDTAKERPQEGEVMAVGPGKRDESGNLVPMDVKEGDKVLYGKYLGIEVKFGEEKYLVMSQDAIIGVLEDL